MNAPLLADKDTPMLLSIIIPTHSRPARLAALLQSLRAASYDRAQTELIVISNLPDSRARAATNAVSGDFARVYYRELGRVGVNFARNKGLESARGDIVLFIDDDCEVTNADFLNRHLAHHRAHPEVIAIGGTYSVADDAPVLERAYHAISSEWINAPSTGGRPSWNLVGGNVSYKRALLNLDNWRFNEGIVFGGAETELHRRLSNAGHRAYVYSDIALCHHCDLTPPLLIRKALKQGRRANRKISDWAQPSSHSSRGIWDRSCLALAFFFYAAAHNAGFALAASDRPDAIESANREALFFAYEIIRLAANGYMARIRHGARRIRQQTKDVARRGYWSAFHLATEAHGKGKALGTSLYWAFRRHVNIALCKRMYWFLYQYLYWGIYKRVYTSTRHNGFAIARSAAKSTAHHLHWKLIHPARSWIRDSLRRLRHEPIRFAIDIAKKSPARIGRFSLNLATSASAAFRRGRKALQITPAGSATQIKNATVGFADRQRSRLENFRHGFKFVGFYLSHLHIEGSKTSRYLHEQWKQKTRFDDNASVYIPTGSGSGSGPGSASDARRILDYAAQARRFGFSTLLFSDDILKLDSVRSTVSTLRDDGFDIEIFYHPSSVHESDPNTNIDWRLAEDLLIEDLRLIGCKLTPVLEDRSSDITAQRDQTHRFIMFPEGRRLRSPSLSQWPLAPPTTTEPRKFMHVDLFNRPDADSRLSHATARAVLKSSTLTPGSFEVRQVFQPFECHELSPVRLLEGRVSWQNQVLQTQPNWSIVIPCYRQFDYLPTVIDHLIAQSYDLRQVEILIVDDGSPVPAHESLATALSARAGTSASIRVIRLERHHQNPDVFDTTFRAGVARNAGIFHSRGKKILFLDSDIILPSDHLLKLDRALEVADVVQSVRHMLGAEASSKSPNADHVDLARDTYAEDTYWESFKRINDWNSLSAPWKYVCSYALALNRETLNRVKYFRPEFCEYGFEDTEMGFRLFRLGCRFHLLKSPVFHLFPQDRSFELHFDAEARHRALCQTAQLFHRMHCDPSIFFELRSFMAQTVSRGPAPSQRSLSY